MDLDMVSYLAKLSKLNFTEEELKKAAADMTSIIDIMDTIKEVDVVYNPLADNKNMYLKDLREDIAKDSMETEKILQNAKHSDNCFVVPKVVE
ncbi:MAG TPA: Asp-tRNA(Asn)/Glu-tRNA(Gln) amidotransferase subunit GatC [Oscillospiraceae bacterium]|nr:Asp-tRNA(Asn)/Glu-tRNA(Gln) amidotransferase subunit GatC [Oscillospiraceae bacterium]